MRWLRRRSEPQRAQDQTSGTVERESITLHEQTSLTVHESPAAKDSNGGVVHHDGRHPAETLPPASGTSHTNPPGSVAPNISSLRHLSARLSSQIGEMLLRLDNQLYSAAQLQLLARRIMQDMSHLIEVCYVQQRLLRTMNSSNPIEMRAAYATLVKLTAELEASLDSYSTVLEETDPRLAIVGPKSRLLSPRLWERALDEPEALQRITGGPSSTVARKSGLWARRKRKRRSRQQYAKLVQDMQGMYLQILMTAQVVQSMTRGSTYAQRMQIAGAIGRLVPLVDWLAEGLEDFRAAYAVARRSE